MISQDFEFDYPALFLFLSHLAMESEHGEPDPVVAATRFADPSPRAVALSEELATELQQLQLHDLNAGDHIAAIARRRFAPGEDPAAWTAQLIAAFAIHAGRYAGF